MKTSIITLLLFGFMSASPVAAQLDIPPKYEIQRFTPEQGLPDINVHVVYEDHLGFLWIGTLNGLARFDGYTFNSYKPIEGDTTSIGLVDISVILEDKAGNLWIGGAEGLSHFNRATEQFFNYYHDPENNQSILGGRVNSLIFQDEQQEYMIMGTHGGISRIHLPTWTFQHQVHEENPSPFLQMGGTGIKPQGISITEEGTIWAGAWGLYNYDASLNQEYRMQPDPRFPNFSMTDWPRNMRNDVGPVIRSSVDPKTLWFGSRGGLYRFNIRSETFDVYYAMPELLETRPDDQMNQQVVALYDDQKGTLWAGTRNGLWTFDLATKSYEHFSETGIRGRTVWSIIEDRNDDIWLGTGDGLIKIVRAKYPITRYADSPFFEPFISMGGAIVEGNDGILYIGGSKGVVRYDPVKQTPPELIEIEANGNSLITGLLLDSNNNLWLSNANNQIAAVRYNLDTEEVKVFVHDPNNPTSIGSNSAGNFYEDEEGMIWIAIWQNGFDRYDPATDIFTHYTHDPADPSSFPAITGESFFQHSSNPSFLWISAFVHGIIISDLETGLFNPLPGEPLLFPGNLQETQDGRIYGSSRSGFHQIDPQKGVIQTFTEENGLLHRTIMSIEEDDNGLIWLQTPVGLSRFNPDKNTFWNFAIDLTTNLSGGSSFKHSSGELFFFTRQHWWSSFHPDDIHPPLLPSVTFTGMDISGIQPEIGAHASMDSSIVISEHTELKHHQNEITFHYASLGQPNPENISYRYRLANYDTEWVQAGKIRQARYPKLPPGTYTFQVQASKSNFEWGAIQSHSITILPPWWQTSLAFVVYGLSFIVGFISVDRFRRQRIIAKERQQAQIREAKLEAQAAQALSREATAMARESDAQARALQAENERKQVELEKAKELEAAHNELESSYEELQQTLTHLHQTQDQLLHSKKLASLGQLTAGIAHEIKNPLNFVNNFSRLSKDLMDELEEWIEERNIQPDETLEDILESLKLNVVKIHHHGTRADGIVQSMLEHSRTEPGKQRATDLNNLLDEYANLAFHSWKAAHNGEAQVPIIVRQYDKGIGEINLIPQNIGRVLINLVDNALYSVGQKTIYMNSTTTMETDSVRYIPEISVSTIKNENFAEIRIADNGIGIPKEIQNKIFEPFFTTKPTGSGTGLGLSLSYDIVVQGHGGELLIESEERKGAEFIIRLPA